MNNSHMKSISIAWKDVKTVFPQTHTNKHSVQCVCVCVWGGGGGGGIKSALSGAMVVIYIYIYHPSTVEICMVRL